MINRLQITEQLSLRRSFRDGVVESRAVRVSDNVIGYPYISTPHPHPPQ